jgi:hypothetical protein
VEHGVVALVAGLEGVQAEGAGRREVAGTALEHAPTTATADAVLGDGRAGGLARETEDEEEPARGACCEAEAVGRTEGGAGAARGREGAAGGFRRCGRRA